MSELTVLIIWVIPYLVAFYTLHLIRGRDDGDADGPPPPPDSSPPPETPYAPGPHRYPRRSSRRGPRDRRGPAPRRRHRPSRTPARRTA